jgi:hypothetical protein
MFLVLLVSTFARAAVDVRCDASADAPHWYTNDRAQLAFALNHLALNTTFSPLHGAFAAQPGHARVTMELAVAPGLSCERRFYADRTATVDSNHSPVLPRPRVAFASPERGGVVVYGAAGFTPPIPMGRATTVTASGEMGLGFTPTDGTAISARFHYAHTRMTADLFPPADGTEAVDFFDGSTFGADVVTSFTAGPLRPYLAIGVVDVSSFAWQGETSAVVDNYEPYAGAAFSFGTEVNVQRFTAAVEVYDVPGQLLTVRAAGGVEF